MDFDLRLGTAVLERTPHTLRAMLEGLPAAWIDATEGPDTWSPYVIVGHLIHGESVGQSLTGLLDEFASLRAENLATLHGWRLTAEQLGLEGEHPDFGRVTLRQLLATWVAHDLGHVAQAARVMAKQYREAIGPWRAYLPIVDR